MALSNPYYYMDAKYGDRSYWWFSRHASKLNYHASEKQSRLPFNELSQEIEIS